MAIFRFFCDESYDSDPQQDPENILRKGKKPHVPKTYVVAGFFADERTWKKIEKPWSAKNKRIGVSRFHAAYVNARDGEFKGWGKNRRNRYAKYMLRLLKDRGRKLHAVSCGMFVRDYERIISDAGREQLGHPYIVCFKSCIDMIAKEMEMEGFPPEDKFAVIIDRNEYESEAVEVFYKMKDSVEWPLHHRLATCAPGGWEEFVALEAADLIAYDTFRLLHDKHYDARRIRKSLESMFDKNGFLGYYYGVDTLQRIREPLERSTCMPNGFIVSVPSAREQIEYEANRQRS